MRMPQTTRLHSGQPEHHRGAVNNWRKVVPAMRIFICFEGSSTPIDVPPDQTVGAIKQMIKGNFMVQLSNDKPQQYLELSYGGAVLQDSWALFDVGITSGRAIRCLIKTEQKPAMWVFNAVTGETLPVMGNEASLHMSVAHLKTVISMQTGLPVSTFRLSTPAGVQLYDCNQLKDYAIKEGMSCPFSQSLQMPAQNNSKFKKYTKGFSLKSNVISILCMFFFFFNKGTTLRLDTWDGWVQYLRGCLRGHKLMVQGHLLENLPVMRFQLQVALYIAAALGHLDLAWWLLERGMHAEKPVGVHPYRQWCHQTSHRDTWKCPIHTAAEKGQLLILKLFISKNPLALACRDPAGRNPLKVAVQHGHSDCVHYLANKLCSQVSLPNIVLPMRIYIQIKRWVCLGHKRAASNRCQYTCAAFNARMGDTLLVDGFNQPNMSSNSMKVATKPSRRIKITHNQDVRSREDCLLDKISPHCSRMAKEKAIYCLTIASTFTEKPWLEQLSIARTLIRRHDHNMA
ncbi:protein ANKUB1-like [Pungitius pungitius]|uniref:protein ANKUB1-like n=1 Tax=Pungitius pungitius TaxID=134920 RepID=UPI002E156077